MWSKVQTFEGQWLVKRHMQTINLVVKRGTKHIESYGDKLLSKTMMQK